MVDSPAQIYPLKVGVVTEFHRFVSIARGTIDLVSPWLSPEVVKVLAEKAEENELEVRIITTKDITNKVHEESLRILRDKSAHIRTKTSEQRHVVDGIF
jgi:hypothetical protein